ncbi:cytochrome b5-like heme/steroid binding domain-containing protein [Hyaloraphidium curvatum]|nr:cytochrome b5-like heme/steroid binding domain-containing protein [Hyaloraphidium curvatum]
MSDKKISRAEVAKHNTQDSAWIILDGGVYDLTKFMKVHPGGPKPILSFAGRDASLLFHQVHEHIIGQVTKNRARMQIGVVSDEKL